MLKKLVRKTLRKIGYDFVNFPKGAERLDMHLHQIFEQIDINFVIDVGANQGQHGQFLRDEGYAGRIVSFEPVNQPFQQLKQVAKDDPNWHVHQLALGDKDAILPINVTEVAEFSSFLQPNQFAETRYGNGPVIDHTEDVQTRRLDDVWLDLIDPLLPAKPIIMLKSDTQGFDLQVLAGAANSLERVGVIQIEVAMLPLYHHAVTLPEVVDTLKELGFELSGLFPISRYKNLYIMTFDAVFVRRSRDFAALGEGKS